MSYTVTVKTIDTTNRGFLVVEETIKSGANVLWSEKDSVWMLVMGGSGASGTLRFNNGTGEQFVVALGIHNFERWCDIVTDVAPGEDSEKIQAEYYTETHPRYGMLWEQLDQIQRKSARGTAVDVKYVKQSGNSFVVHIFIASCD